MLEVKLQSSWIHYLSSHSLEKGHTFILVCSKMVSQKISFSQNYIKTAWTQILQYGTKIWLKSYKKQVNRNYSVAHLLPTIQTQSSFNV